jgi:hypothetical protein
MRLNTTKRYIQIVFTYIIIALLFLFDMINFQSEGGKMILTPYLLLILGFFIYRGNPVFVYDSDGEVIIINNREPSLAKFSRAFAKQYEFPKRKLKSYSIISLPFRRILTLKVESKEKGTKVMRFGISYINKQELKDLERSLRGILSKNKKMKEANES